MNPNQMSSELQRFLNLFDQLMEQTFAYLKRVDTPAYASVPVDSDVMFLGTRVSKINIGGLVRHLILAEPHWFESLSSISDGDIIPLPGNPSLFEGVGDGQPLVEGYELNVSCPNVKEGLRFGLDAEATASLIRAVRPLTDGVLMAKLTPNVTDVAEQAIAAAEAGADSISVINTLRAMAIDWRTGESRIGTETGGLSGPAIRPIALRVAMEVCRAVKVPVCAIGGITCAQDILEFASVGASLVQVGTHLYREPGCLPGILTELRELLASEGYSSLEAMRGNFDGGRYRLPDRERPVP